MYGESFIIREIRGRLRKRMLIGYAAFYIGIIALVGVVSYLHSLEEIKSYTQGRIAAAESVIVRAIMLENVRNWYMSIMGFHYVLIFVGSAFAASAISSENEKKTYDFLATLPLRPFEIVFGKFIGAPVVIYLALLVSIPVTLLAVVSGAIPFLHWLINFVVMVFFAFAVFSIGFLASCLLKKTTASIIGTFILLGCILLISAGIMSEIERHIDNVALYFGLPSPFSYMRTDYLVNTHGQDFSFVYFFGLKVPSLVITLFYYIAATVISLLVASRKIFDQTRPMLAKWQALVIFAGIQILLFGASWPNASSRYFSYPFFPMMSIISLFLLWLMAVIVTPDYSSTRWWIMHGDKEAPGIKKFLHDRAYPYYTLFAGFIFFLLLFLLAYNYDTRNYDTSAFRHGGAFINPFYAGIVFASGLLVIMTLQFFALYIKKFNIAAMATIALYVIIIVLSFIAQWAASIVLGANSREYIFCHLLNPFAGFAYIDSYSYYEKANKNLPFGIAQILLFILISAAIGYFVSRKLNRMKMEIDRQNTSKG